MSRARRARPTARSVILGWPRGAGPRRIAGAVTESHAVWRRLTALGLGPAAEPPAVSNPLESPQLRVGATSVGLPVTS